MTDTGQRAEDDRKLEIEQEIAEIDAEIEKLEALEGVDVSSSIHSKKTKRGRLIKELKAMGAIALDIESAVALLLENDDVLFYGSDDSPERKYTLRSLRGYAHTKTLTSSALTDQKLIAASGGSGEFWQSLVGAAGFTDSFATKLGLRLVAEILATGASRLPEYSPSSLRGYGAHPSGVFNIGRGVLHSETGEFTPHREVAKGSKSEQSARFAALKDIRCPDRRERGKYAEHFVRLCRAVAAGNWDNPLDGYIVVGHTYMTIASGALKRRPHLIVTGAPNTGKSHYFDTYQPRMLRGWTADSETTRGGEFIFSMATAAGAIQAAGSNALGMVVDDVDVSTDEGLKKLADLLNIAHISFSGGGRVTGTAEQRAHVQEALCVFQLVANGHINFEAREGGARRFIELRVPEKTLDESDSEAVLADQDRFEERDRVIMELTEPEHADGMLSEMVYHLREYLDTNSFQQGDGVWRRLLPRLGRDAATLYSPVLAALIHMSNGALDNDGTIDRIIDLLESRRVVRESKEHTDKLWPLKKWLNMEAEIDRGGFRERITHKELLFRAICAAEKGQVKENGRIVSRLGSDAGTSEWLAERLTRVGVGVFVDGTLLINPKSECWSRRVLGFEKRRVNPIKELLEMPGAEKRASQFIGQQVKTAVAVPLLSWSDHREIGEYCARMKDESGGDDDAGF